MKPVLRKTTIRQHSRCITKKYSSFHIVYIEYNKKVRRKFLPSDIKYDPALTAIVMVGIYIILFRGNLSSKLNFIFIYFSS